MAAVGERVRRRPRRDRADHAREPVGHDDPRSSHPTLSEPEISAAAQRQLELQYDDVGDVTLARGARELLQRLASDRTAVGRRDERRLPPRPREARRGGRPPAGARHRRRRRRRQAGPGRLPPRGSPSRRPDRALPRRRGLAAGSRGGPPRRRDRCRACAAFPPMCRSTTSPRSRRCCPRPPDRAQSSSRRRPSRSTSPPGSGPRCPSGVSGHDSIGRSHISSSVLPSGSSR